MLILFQTIRSRFTSGLRLDGLYVGGTWFWDSVFEYIENCYVRDRPVNGSIFLWRIAFIKLSDNRLVRYLGVGVMAHVIVFFHLHWRNISFGTGGRTAGTAIFLRIVVVIIPVKIT